MTNDEAAKILDNIWPDECGRGEDVVSTEREAILLGAQALREVGPLKARIAELEERWLDLRIFITNTANDELDGYGAALGEMDRLEGK
jgi:hypothetical protein